MIDALNEGAGRTIWPDHMNAFLELIARSPWIAVAVSVRSNYEQLVLPAGVIAAATRVTHEGFADHEYDASKTFFKHYGIELPSTPLLAPEYRSPLFLKSICLGLQDAGHTRLPRGFHGITQVFQLYTGAINSRLAKSLDFDEKAQLVQKALKHFVAAFPSHRRQWLSRDEAMTLVDGLLPGRSFQNSLYQNLVGEGLFARLALHLDVPEVLVDGVADRCLLRNLGRGPRPAPRRWIRGQGARPRTELPRTEFQRAAQSIPWPERSGALTLNPAACMV